MIQERTPELRQKITRLSCEKDPWCKIIYDSKVTGLSRLMALNCYIIAQQDNNLQLALKLDMAHLDKADIHQTLTTALKQLGLSYSLVVNESDEHKTALEIKRDILDELVNEAKTALLDDSKLKLLNSAFDISLEEAIVRPVA